jgi:hypothetical protein
VQQITPAREHSTASGFSTRTVPYRYRSGKSSESQMSSTSASARACFPPAAASCGHQDVVSRKYLSLMEFGARLGRRPLEIEPFTEPGERAASNLVERLSLSHDASRRSVKGR